MMSGRCDLQDIRSVIGGLAREARIELPLRGVAAGMYIARARVRVGPDTVAEVVREVEIRDGQRPSDADEADVDAFDPREIADGAVARHFSIGASAQKTQAVDRLRQRDYAAAVAAFQSVLASEPDNGEAAFLLGWRITAPATIVRLLRRGAARHSLRRRSFRRISRSPTCSRDSRNPTSRFRRCAAA